MVARIAPEPINANVAVPEYRSRSAAFDARTSALADLPDPLPPVQQPVPTPVPAPAIVPPAEAFAAALVAEQMAVRPVTFAEVRLRAGSSPWQAPDSSLRLADRRA